MLHRLADVLLSPDPRLRRLLGYWAASGLFYLVSIVVLQLQVRAGSASPHGAYILSWFGVAGVLFFFALVRVSFVLRIAPWRLAVLQALFAIVCNIGAYVVTGPIRGASLMILLVVMVFCTFSLRPRATLGLCATAIGALGLTMWWLSSTDPLHFPAQVELMHFSIVSCSLLAVTLLTGEMSKLRANLKQQKQELMAAVGKIRTLATVDELTSLANRRYMNEVLSAEERRHGAPDQPMCIALLDIDFFKNVNDRFGHDAGDTVLRNFAAAARTELRAGDVLARWGGEEFLLMLPATDVGMGQLVLRRMAERVRAAPIPGLDMNALTFSAGLVERGRKEPFSETIVRADKAMYQAKMTGRDKIVTA
ncbi:MAG: diguanylate cyclase [Pseudomonadota bacterium]